MTEEEIDKFFTNHLKYRLYMLNSHQERDMEFSNDPAILTCMFEASLISCRVFMEFLGLGIDNSNPPKLEPHRKYFSKDKISSFEVKVKDLGGNFVDIDSSLSSQEQYILAHVFLSAHRSTAHLTTGSPFIPKPEWVKKAAVIIRRLLKDNLEYVRLIENSQI